MQRLFPVISQDLVICRKLASKTRSPCDQFCKPEVCGEALQAFDQMVHLDNFLACQRAGTPIVKLPINAIGLSQKIALGHLPRQKTLRCTTIEGFRLLARFRMVRPPGAFQVSYSSLP